MEKETQKLNKVDKVDKIDTVTPDAIPEIFIPQQLANSNEALVRLGYAQVIKKNKLGQIIDLHIDIAGIAKFMGDVVSKFEGLGNKP